MFSSFKQLKLQWELEYFCAFARSFCDEKRFLIVYPICTRPKFVICCSVIAFFILTLHVGNTER